MCPQILLTAFGRNCERSERCMLVSTISPPEQMVPVNILQLLQRITAGVMNQLDFRLSAYLPRLPKKLGTPQSWHPYLYL